MRNLILLPMLALAACQNSAPLANNVSEAQREADAPVRDVDVIPADETAAAAEGEGDGAPPPEQAVIPAALHGRWGMTPADCDPARDDNKGLMTVTADMLAFYESRARLQSVTSAETNQLTGRFAFSGEGQTWTADMTLTRQGDTLTREEDGPRLTYKRCA